jgi:hypothetical protein
MESKILKYYKVNIDGYPIYLEVRPVCTKRYLCFFSTLYNKDEFFIEDRYETFGFKVIDEEGDVRFIVSGKLTPVIASAMWQQISNRLDKPDNEINFYASTIDTMAIANFKL